MNSRNALAKLGARTHAFLEELSSAVWLGRATLAELGDRLGNGRAPFRLGEFFFQTNRVGVGSVPMIILLSMFIGLTLALLTGYQLRKFGVTTLVPAVCAITFSREMGPLFTGVVLASRIGSAYTAELGSMVAGGEVDAIEAMGIGPLRYLVVPRWLAIFCLTPCLSIVAITAGIFGGALISDLLLQMNYGYFYDQVFANLLVRDIVSGAVKSVLFGAIIGLVACYKGMSVRGGAVGVGLATTSSVVVAISAVIVCDSFCNIFIVTIFSS